MSTMSAQTPARSFPSILRSVFAALFTSADAPRGFRAGDVAHLSDEMLRDIGLERFDTMGADARRASNTLKYRTMW